MKIQGKQVVEFEIIMDDNHKISYYVLSQYFHEYGNLFDHTTNNILKLSYAFSSKYMVIYDYLCDKNLMRKTNNMPPTYEILDLSKLNTELVILYQISNDLGKNYKSYERDFLLDSLI